MKYMKKVVFLCLIFLQTTILYSQSDQYIGINIMQLFAKSVNINYRIDKYPRLSYLFEGGLTFNYTQQTRDPEWLFNYDPWMSTDTRSEKISGGFLKIGLLTRSVEKKNYLNVGISLINSVIHEEGIYEDCYYDDDEIFHEDDIPFNQTYYKMGFGFYLGYNLKISKKIATNMGFQSSFSLKGSKEGYWMYEFIPGMGINSAESHFRLMPVINISYKLK